MNGMSSTHQMLNTNLIFSALFRSLFFDCIWCMGWVRMTWIFTALHHYRWTNGNSPEINSSLNFIFRRILHAWIFKKKERNSMKQKQNSWHTKYKTKISFMLYINTHSHSLSPPNTHTNWVRDRNAAWKHF